MLTSDSRRTLQSLYASNLKTLGQHDIPARHRNLLQGRVLWVQPSPRQNGAGCSKSPYTSRALPRFWIQKVLARVPTRVVWDRPAVLVGLCTFEERSPAGSSVSSGALGLPEFTSECRVRRSATPVTTASIPQLGRGSPPPYSVDRLRFEDQ